MALLSVFIWDCSEKNTNGDERKNHCLGKYYFSWNRSGSSPEDNVFFGVYIPAEYYGDLCMYLADTAKRMAFDYVGDCCLLFAFSTDRFSSGLFKFNMFGCNIFDGDVSWAIFHKDGLFSGIAAHHGRNCLGIETE